MKERTTREILAEAVYCLELAAPYIPKVYRYGGSEEKSALTARIDSLIDFAYNELDDGFWNEVRNHGDADQANENDFTNDVHAASAGMTQTPIE